MSSNSQLHTLVSEGRDVIGLDAGDLVRLSNDQINAKKAILGLSRTNSSADTIPSLVLSARQVALDKRLDRVL